MELLIRDPGVGSHDGWLTDAALSRPHDSSQLSEPPEAGGGRLVLDLCARRRLPTSPVRAHIHVQTHTAWDIAVTQTRAWTPPCCPALPSVSSASPSHHLLLSPPHTLPETALRI